MHLLPKCNAYSAYKGILIECNVEMQHLHSYFQSGIVVETLARDSAEKLDEIGPANRTVKKRISLLLACLHD